MGGVATYDTRPMSDGWSKPHDIDPWADSRAHIDFVIPLTDFPRLAPQLANTEGNACGHVQFDRRQGIAVADVEVAADANLRCQRCLAPLHWRIESRGSVAMVEEGLEAERVPPELETIRAPEHRISIRELIEEELMLSLPIVPLHDVRECAPVAVRVETDSAPDRHDERYRPFERLGELFKRGE